MAELRLDKLLCFGAPVSRSEARALARSGRVCVDGVTERSPDRKLDPAAHAVELDGTLLRCDEYRCYLLNKPAGVLSATEDAVQRTVLDLFPAEIRRAGIFPVGRLDRDTTGLLLLTNDGAFAHALTSPRKGIPKVYRALTDSPMTEGDAAAFAEGLLLRDGTRCGPAALALLPGGECQVTLTEGKYHQVKRMIASRGKQVLSLERVAVGGLRLPPELGRGEYLSLPLDAVRDAIFAAETNVRK